ncbi:MAG: GntR family transcriptional regulator [Microbacterium gubbeenense]|uniref:GntR family transcriptional regulator n=1 Tax=Microbacterium gubbeenense TaxID=159896 RepID=UPI003F9E4BB3
MADNSHVRNQLREAILRGTYAPRQRLIEAELAEEYGASRFVLRNALIQLASEGLVEMQPNRGARVREVTVAEAVEITEIRQAIESLVAARAAERVSDEQADYLRELGDQMRAAVDHNELVKYSELNTALHTTLREIAGHDTGSRMLEQLNGQMVKHQFQLFLVPGRPNTSLPEHLAIISAVCARDPEAARAAMHTHVGSVVTTLEEFAENSAASV